jgi:Heterokaryon incompatibility protein (HET)
MSFRDVYAPLFRVSVLLLKLKSHIVSMLWLSYLVFKLTCYHLPRILLHRPRDGNPGSLCQPMVSSKPVDQQQHEDLESYQYEPLPEDQYIRLLQIKESHGGSDDEYELLTVSLDHSLASYLYRAISYTWDGQVPDRFIVCSGKKLAITQNCETILRHMRRRAKFFLWIDAICIDSSSVHEKSRQIRLMSNIYSRAFVVSIWLGNPTDGVSIAYSYFWLLWCCSVMPEPVGSWLGDRVTDLISGRFSPRKLYPHSLTDL